MGPTNGERIFTILISLTIVFVFLYLALRDDSLPEDQLSTIHVTLRATPKYYVYKIKSTTYRDIILTTKEYKRTFKITGMTYAATDHTTFNANVFGSDKVELRVKTTDLDNLNENDSSNNATDVYGISKNGIQYVNLNLRTELVKEDSKWAYFFVIVGLVMLPYGFINGKPLISMNHAITTTMVAGLLLMLILSRL